jgi:hypothetical protein
VRDPIERSRMRANCNHYCNQVAWLRTRRDRWLLHFAAVQSRGLSQKPRIGNPQYAPMCIGGRIWRLTWAYAPGVMVILAHQFATSCSQSGGQSGGRRPSGNEASRWISTRCRVAYRRGGRAGRGCRHTCRLASGSVPAGLGSQVTVTVSSVVPMTRAAMNCVYPSPSINSCSSWPRTPMRSPMVIKTLCAGVWLSFLMMYVSPWKCFSDHVTSSDLRASTSAIAVDRWRASADRSAALADRPAASAALIAAASALRADLSAFLRLWMASSKARLAMTTLATDTDSSQFTKPRQYGACPVLWRASRRLLTVTCQARGQCGSLRSDGEHASARRGLQPNGRTARSSTCSSSRPTTMA